jgi:hypothetical protein
MKAYLLAVVVVVGCGEVNPVRHLPDALPADAADEGDGNDELRVTIAGNGVGSVMSNPDGINCSTSTCSARFAHNSEVQLTAMSDNTSDFVGWSGACYGMQPTCKIDLASARDVTATFALKKYTVTVAKAGVGMGTVSGSGIACGETCSITVEHGASVSLSAAPASLSVFAGWGGACSGTGACNTTITHDTTINANFALDDFTLFVSRGGTGTGSIASNPTGISCGTDCDQTFTANQSVTLTATPATSSTFGGWSGGGCSGTGTCAVTMTAATTVTGTFAIKKFALNVAKDGTGLGTVTGTGISCGTDCTETFNYGTSVTLSANPATGSTFGGWAGACSGTGSCTVSMTAIRNVTATFTANTYTLSVDRTGNGLGVVTATGIDCGTDCSESYAHGTSVTLTATPSTAAASLSTFGGWGGACSGTGTCTIPITAATSVTANFSLKPNLMFVTNNTYDGNVNGIAGADKRCTDAAGQAGLPGTYRAYLSSAIMGIAGPIPFHAPGRFAGASGWVRTDGQLVVKSINEFHSGMISNAPMLTEFGTSVANTQYLYVWTGTVNGQFANQCMPVGAWGIWNGTGNSAWAGKATAVNTQAVALDSFSCTAQMRLYCFGIDRNATPQ